MILSAKVASSVVTLDTGLESATILASQSALRARAQDVLLYHHNNVTSHHMDQTQLAVLTNVTTRVLQNAAATTHPTAQMELVKHVN